ncbi:conserved hypothetical protein [Ricinus communis]|uniref:Uncharacterized protein n=1 Tax=Ricinus communis TaxID=3988 RepID=B9S6L8_RICCO|nr:conserved hypothetical protein [Ricinus communis]
MTQGLKETKDDVGIMEVLHYIANRNRILYLHVDGGVLKEADTHEFAGTNEVVHEQDVVDASSGPEEIEEQGDYGMDIDVALDSEWNWTHTNEYIKVTEVEF